jgi:hypothetical protein
MRFWVAVVGICLWLPSLECAAQNKTDNAKQQPVKSAPDKKKKLKGPFARDGYEDRPIEGFTVRLHEKVLDHENDAEYKRKPLDVLELELNTITRSATRREVEALRKVPIWVEWDDKDDPDWGKAVAKYYGVKGNAFIWTLAKGKHPAKAKCIEIISLKSLTREHQPGVKLERCVILHEMAHAVQFELCGPDNPRIKDAYKQAMERKLYDKAKDVNGREIKPYARTNEREYFAELSCAYLNKLHYFPFDREHLKEHDPTGYKMMEDTWGSRKKIDAAVKNESENAARNRLEKAKGLQTEKKKSEAIAALEKLLEFYPNTKAAKEAKSLLEKLTQ